MKAFTPAYFKDKDISHLPGLLDIEVIDVDVGALKAELDVKTHHLAINGYLHAGTVVSIADTAAGYGCLANLPDNAIGFTTIELKCNLMGTVRGGRIACHSRCSHSGRTTQVWESEVLDLSSAKVIAKFLCTQLILYR